VSHAAEAASAAYQRRTSGRRAQDATPYGEARPIPLAILRTAL